IGPALTLPRYPMNLFYNVGTRAEEIDEYNWIYNSAADGGSGNCELHSNTSTCISPLHSSDGFENYIAPEQARQMLMNVLANSPKPYYAHQSNLAEDRILYRPLELLLQQYRQLLANNSPLANPTMAEAGSELQRRTQWHNAKAQIQAYVQDQRLFLSVQGGDAETATPVTLPAASNAPTLTALGSKRTGWLSVSAATNVSCELPDSVQYARAAAAPAAVPSTNRAGALALGFLLFAVGFMRLAKRDSGATQ
ncbi:MAG TPA: hypothetical protein VFN67_21915, partial [Polyangiales bacterium]|nr:hypothetical protein [Polyangiales bacterium]